MDEKKSRSINMGFQIFSLVIIAASLLSYFVPELASVFVFDRAAILRGEIWRLVTCHFVHFSNEHLMYNLFAFCLGGYVIECKNYLNLYLLYLCLAIFISISLFTLKPDMAFYGGLSGIACGFLFYTALMGIKETRPWQTICLLIVFFLPIKIAVEIYNSASILPYFGNQSFVPMQTSHVVGCLVALLFYLYANMQNNALTIAFTRRQEARRH